MPRAGQLDTEVTIQRKGTVTQDANGRPITPWIPFEYAVGSPSVAQRYWAEVSDAQPSRDEGVQQGLVVGKQRCRVRFRWVDGLDSSMRVVIHRNTDTTWQIIGGPAMLGTRTQFCELSLERSTV